MWMWDKKIQHFPFQWMFRGISRQCCRRTFILKIKPVNWCLAHWGRDKTAAILRTTFSNTVWISLQTSLKFVPKVRINNIPALIQITAWRRPSGKPLSKPMMVSLLTQMRHSASMSSLLCTNNLLVLPMSMYRCHLQFWSDIWTKGEFGRKLYLWSFINEMKVLPKWQSQNETSRGIIRILNQNTESKQGCIFTYTNIRPWSKQWIKQVLFDATAKSTLILNESFFPSISSRCGCLP